MKKFIVPLALLSLFAVSASRADEVKTDAVDLLNSATKTLQEIAAAPDKGIPEEVLKSAKCVAVVPRMLKGGFIFGGKHGRGVATCRLPDGSWSAPVFFTITGGSWGAQIGVENVELVIMVMNDDGMRHLLENKFQVGGEISGAAGPVGRHASAGTDWKAETELLTYSRAKGLFAGVDLGGSWVEHDRGTTTALYSRDYSNTDLLTGKVSVPAEARPFIAEVSRLKTEAQGNKANKIEAEAEK